MPRPKRDLTLTSVYLSGPQIARMDELAERYGCKRSDVLRAMLDAAMTTNEAMSAARKTLRG